MADAFDRYNVLVKSTAAAERNKVPIQKALDSYLRESPAGGVVLECASGMGTHVAHLARTFPRLTWQPSELETHSFPDIEASAAGLANVRRPVVLDLRAGALPDGVQRSSLFAVLAVNVTHIAPFSATLGLMDVAAAGLSDGAWLFIYGPFLVNGAATTESNAAFDASLRARDPEWGYRDVDEVMQAAQRVGLQRVDAVDMPANNFLLVMQKQT